jgi:hypothetical protein
MSSEDVYWTRVHKDVGGRQNSWELLRELLKNVMKPDGPRLFVFHSCRQFIRRVPVLLREQGHVMTARIVSCTRRCKYVQMQSAGIPSRCAASRTPLRLGLSVGLSRVLAGRAPSHDLVVAQLQGLLIVKPAPSDRPSGKS